MDSIPHNSQLKFWLSKHANATALTLKEWLKSTYEWSGHNSFVLMFVYNRLGGDEGILKTNLKPATHEVARHQGIIGDWSVKSTEQLLEATIVFKDGTLAKVILSKTKEEQMAEHTGYEGTYYDEHGKSVASEGEAVRFVYGAMGHTVEDARATIQDAWISWSEWCSMTQAGRDEVHSHWAMYK